MSVYCDMKDCKHISKRRTRVILRSGEEVLLHTCRRRNVVIVPAVQCDSMFTEKYIAKCICYDPKGDEVDENK